MNLFYMFKEIKEEKHYHIQKEQVDSILEVKCVVDIG